MTPAAESQFPEPRESDSPLQQADEQVDPLDDRGRTPAEREVLRVLWANPGQSLVRGEIHRRIPRSERPTPGRVGQILADFYDLDLLRRVRRRSQGSRQAAFYTLSDLGLELCRRLDFDREDEALFSTTKEMLETFLTRERLSSRPSAPGRVVAFCGYQGGLGRSTMVAHVARGLAERHGERKLLAIDLALDAPGLDAFFAPEGLGDCRGLGGLLVDYHQQRDWERAEWLRHALTRSEYVLQPLEDVPNLFYLPSGLTPGHDTLSSFERAEALSLLREEIGLPRLAGRSEPNTNRRGFLKDFRSASLEHFGKVLVDPQVGRSFGTWISIHALADELVLCSRITDTSAATLEGLRAILANFIRRRHEESAKSSVLFLFPVSEPGIGRDADGWVDQYMANQKESDDASPSAPYRTELLVYNNRLMKNPRQWTNTKLYEPLIVRLENPRADAARITSPELRAFLDVLNPETPWDRRSVAAGFLENSPPQEFIRWATWYVEDESLHRITDADGKKQIERITETQAGNLAQMILKASQ